MSIHHGISCDLCRRKNFSGRRYKCLICSDFDLCELCYDSGRNFNIKTHFIHHPMQIILTKNDYELVYFGYKNKDNSYLSLTCPYCNKNGFIVNNLTKHVDDCHRRLTYNVLCPVCFLQQTNLNNHLSQHIEKPTVKNEKQCLQSIDESLLESLINVKVNQNDNKNEKRSMFIYCLLTDLLYK